MLQQHVQILMNGWCTRMNKRILLILVLLILVNVQNASAWTCDKAVGGNLGVGGYTWTGISAMPTEIDTAAGYGSDCYNAFMTPSQLSIIAAGGTDHIANGITHAHSHGMLFIIRISPKNWVADNNYDTFIATSTAQTAFKSRLDWIMNRYPTLDGIEIEEPQSYNVYPVDGGLSIRTFNNNFFTELKDIVDNYRNLTDGTFMWSFNCASNSASGLAKIGIDTAYINTNILFNAYWAQDSKPTLAQFQSVYYSWQNTWFTNLKVGVWSYVAKDTVYGYNLNFFDEVSWAHSANVPLNVFVLGRLSYPASNWPNNTITGNTAGEVVATIWGFTDPYVPPAPEITNPSISWSNIIKESSPNDCFQTNKSINSTCFKVSYMDIGNKTKKYRSIMFFKDSFPSVSDAKLKLVIQGFDSLRVNETTIELHGFSNSCQTNYINWNNCSSGVPWSSVGGDYGTIIDSITVTLNATINQEITFNITDYLNSNPINPKLFVKSSDANELEAYNYLYLYSFESSTSTYVPTITYTESGIVPSSHTYGEIGDSWTGNYTGDNVSNLYHPNGYMTLTSPLDAIFSLELPTGYVWLRQGSYSLQDGFMWMNSSLNTDMWGSTISAPILKKGHSMIASDWTLTKKLSVISTATDYDTTGLIIWANDTSFVWVGIQNYNFYNSDRSVVIINQTSALIKSAKRTEIANTSTNYWLRITKSGTSYTASYSTDGTTFTSTDTVTWSGIPTEYGLVSIGSISGNTGKFKEYYIQSNDYVSKGNLTWWENTTSGYVASCVDISLTSSGLPYNMYYGDGNTWTNLGQYSGTLQTICTPEGTRYQNTTWNMEFLKTSVSTPTLKYARTAYVESVSTLPEITSWGNSVTNNENLSFSVMQNVSVTLNVTGNMAGQYIWYIGNNTQSESSNIFNASFNYLSTQIIYVYLLANNETSNTVAWYIDVSELPYPLIPESITNLTSTSGNNWINWTWEDGGGVNLTNYYTVYELYDNSFEELISSTQSAYLNYTGLSTITRLNVTVYAINESIDESYYMGISSGVSAYGETRYNHTVGGGANFNLTASPGLNLTVKVRGYNETYSTYSAWNETTVQLEYESVQAAFTQIIMDWWE